LKQFSLSTSLLLLVVFCLAVLVVIERISHERVTEQLRREIRNLQVSTTQFDSPFDDIDVNLPAGATGTSGAHVTFRDGHIEPLVDHQSPKQID
jgi:sensor histidine kinase regulating citrate/malate metabolism